MRAPAATLPFTRLDSLGSGGRTLDDPTRARSSAMSMKSTRRCGLSAGMVLRSTQRQGKGVHSESAAMPHAPTLVATAVLRRSPARLDPTRPSRRCVASDNCIVRIAVRMVVRRTGPSGHSDGCTHCSQRAECAEAPKSSASAACLRTPPKRYEPHSMRECAGEHVCLRL